MPKNAIAIFAGTSLTALGSELKQFTGGVKMRSTLAHMISDMIESGQIAENEVRMCSSVVQALRKHMKK